MIVCSFLLESPAVALAEPCAEKYSWSLMTSAGYTEKCVRVFRLYIPITLIHVQLTLPSTPYLTQTEFVSSVEAHSSLGLQSWGRILILYGYQGLQMFQASIIKFHSTTSRWQCMPMSNRIKSQRDVSII